MTNVDRRGIIRGRCRDDDCRDFLNEGENDCAYCRCPPTKHENLGEYFNAEEFNEKLKDITENIIFLLTGEKEFIDLYPKWRIERLEIINELRRISNSLKDVKKDTNIAKIVGSSIGIVGGLLSLICGICAVTTGGLALIPLTIAGACVGAAGGGINIGAVSTNAIKKSVCSKEIKELARRNEENNKVIRDYADKARKCKSSIDEILDFKTFYDIVKHLSEPNCGTPEEMYEAMKDFICKDLKKEKLEHFLKFCPKLLSVFQSESSKKVSPTSIVDVVGAVTTVSLQSVRAADVGLDLSSVLVRSLTQVGKTVAKISAHAAFSGICVAFDVATLVITAKNMSEDSRSRLAEELDKCVTVLECEMKDLDSIFNKITRCEIEQDFQDVLTVICSSNSKKTSICEVKEES